MLQCPSEDYHFPPKPTPQDTSSEDQVTDHITMAIYPRRLLRDPACDDAAQAPVDAAAHYTVTIVYKSLAKFLPNEQKLAVEREHGFYNTTKVSQRLEFAVCYAVRKLRLFSVINFCS